MKHRKPSSVQPQISSYWETEELPVNTGRLPRSSSHSLTKITDALRLIASKSARQMLHYLANLPVDLDAPKSFHILAMPEKLNVIVMGSVCGNLDARHKM